MAKTEHFETEPFVVGGEYSRHEIAKLANVTPPVNSRDWQGIREYDNCIILFVTLIKSDFEPSQMYADYFDDGGQTFFWDSQNRNTQKTPVIQRIISKDDVILFARITNKVKGKTLPFVYVGGLTAEEWGGEKPVGVSFNVDDYIVSAPSTLTELYEWSPGQQRKIRHIERSESRSRRKQEKQSRAHNAGQGREDDPKKRKAIEIRAMLLAREHYEMEGYRVIDTSANRPFDYECMLAGELRRVEVKGTTSGPGSVTVTINEVNSARDDSVLTDLFIVYGINVRQKNGEWLAEQGEVKLISDWVPQDEDLKPTQFTYILPESIDW